MNLDSAGHDRLNFSNLSVACFQISLSSCKVSPHICGILKTVLIYIIRGSTFYLKVYALQDMS